MKIILSILLLSIVLSIVDAQTVYSQSVDLGQIKKGPVIKKQFNSISLPASSFQLDAVHVGLINKSSNQPFSHDSVSLSTVEFSISGKKVVAFSASNILNPIFFPSPYGLEINGAVDLAVAIQTANVDSHDVALEYSFKWSASTSFTQLNRIATSCVANYSTFNVPGTGSPTYTLSHGVVWPSTVNAMAIQATASQGILSLTIESSTGQVICKSTPVVDKNKILQYMSPCNNVIGLTKGVTYNTVVVYDNTIKRKGVMCNFALYTGSVHTTSTTSTHASTTTASTHSTTTTSTHSTTTGPHTTTGPSSTHSSSHSAGGAGAGGAGSSDGHSSGTSSDFTSGASHDSDSSSGVSSATPTVSPTGYSVSSGAAYNVWNNQRRVEIY